MKRILQAFALAAITFLAASPALAQTAAMPVEIVKPDAWQATETESADKGADWVDPKTENRIEIRTVRIVRDEHASTLREAFEAQLLENRFKRTAATQQRSIPLVNATKRTGFWSE